MTESTAVSTQQAPRGSFLEKMLSLAKTAEERERAYMLAERHAQNQLVQQIAAELTAKSWGNNVSPALRVEVVRWAMEIGADPTTEVDILGGKPFLNAQYWIRLVSNEADFLRPEEIWVHPDPRASAEKNAKRQALRVQWAIPDAIAATTGLFREERKAAANKDPIPVKAAVIVLLHFKERGPFVGKKWSPSRANDDVGMDHPESSALTRAWRKAAMAAVRRKPPFSAKLTNLMVSGRTMDEAGAQLRPLGETPVVSEAAAVAPIAPAKTGVIEVHEPSAECEIAGEHPRTECGLFKKATPEKAPSQGVQS